MEFLSNTQSIGQLSEKKACHFLQTKGLRTIAQNFRCARGEIDLIMQDKDEIVFVEVRARYHTEFGSAIESVDLHKQKKIIKVATHYLQKNGLFDKIHCRFDIIGIDIKSGHIEWLKNAFEPTYF